MSVSPFRVVTIACVSLILGGLAGAQSPPQQVVQVPGGPGSPPYPVVVPWPIPDGAKISSVTTYVQGSTRYVEVQMLAPVATSGGILIKAAYSYDKDGNLVYMGPPDGSNNQVPGGQPWDWWYDG